jgi:5-methylcytosine-specific restriction endonuclease McrA
MQTNFEISRGIELETRTQNPMQDDLQSGMKIKMEMRSQSKLESGKRYEVVQLKEKSNQTSEFKSIPKAKQSVEIRKLDDKTLDQQTKNLVGQERELTVQILHYLQEINRRRYFAKRGYPSLFEYAVKELKYSESQAHRRIAAMRLVNDIPEVEEKLSNGHLTLATVAQAQTFFRQESKATGIARNNDQKRDLLKKLEGKSKRTVEKTLIELCPKLVQSRETLKPIATEFYELKITMTQSQQQKLERLKELKNTQSTAEIIDWMMDLALTKVDPLKKPKVGYSKAKRSNSETQKKSAQRAVSIPGKVNRYIPRDFKQNLWIRSGGQCEFVDHLTERRCECRMHLQIDHIQPIGLGGKTAQENLRLVCRSHNQLFAIQSFGSQQMAKFLPDLR